MCKRLTNEHTHRNPIDFREVRLVIVPIQGFLREGACCTDRRKKFDVVDHLVGKYVVNVIHRWDYRGQGGCPSRKELRRMLVDLDSAERV
jgi:hypothetical protein